VKRAGTYIDGVARKIGHLRLTFTNQIEPLSHVNNETLGIPGPAIVKATGAGDIAKDVAGPIATHRQTRTEGHSGIHRVRGGIGPIS
jgi:hypothetical protein